MTNFKSEIKRAYNVLGGINGEMQNERDINGWYETDMITLDEYRELKELNTKLFFEHMEF